MPTVRACSGLVGYLVPALGAVDHSHDAPPFHRPRYTQGLEAVSEFDRVIAARTINPAHPIHATAILGKARGHALAGDTDAARAAYNDFLTLWRDADPDIPLLEEARAELDAL